MCACVYLFALSVCMSLCACQHVCVEKCLETNVCACTWAWYIAAYVTRCAMMVNSEDKQQGTWQVLKSEVKILRSSREVLRRPSSASKLSRNSALVVL